METGFDGQFPPEETQESELDLDDGSTLDQSDLVEPDEHWAFVIGLMNKLRLGQQAVGEYFLANQGEWMSSTDIIRDTKWPAAPSSDSSHYSAFSSTIARVNNLAFDKFAVAVIEKRGEGIRRKYRFRFVDQTERDFQAQADQIIAREIEYQDDPGSSDKPMTEASDQGLRYSNFSNEVRLEKIVAGILASGIPLPPTEIASRVMERGKKEAAYRNEDGDGYSIGEIVNAAKRLAGRNSRISDTSEQGGRAYLLRKPK